MDHITENLQNKEKTSTPPSKHSNLNHFDELLPAFGLPLPAPCTLDACAQPEPPRSEGWRCRAPVRRRHGNRRSPGLGSGECGSEGRGSGVRGAWGGLSAWAWKRMGISPPRCSAGAGGEWASTAASSVFAFAPSFA